RLASPADYPLSPLMTLLLAVQLLARLGAVTPLALPLPAGRALPLDGGLALRAARGHVALQRRLGVDLRRARLVLPEAGGGCEDVGGVGRLFDAPDRRHGADAPPPVRPGRGAGTGWRRRPASALPMCT